MARQRQQTETTQEQRFLHDDSKVSFSNGVMHVNGQPQMPVETQNWESSNGNTVYTTVKWRDAATGQLRCSCNCPGWAIKKAGKHRQCTHTKDMEGVATCSKKRISTTVIRSAAEAVKAIPDMVDGRELRGFSF